MATTGPATLGSSCRARMEGIDAPTQITGDQPQRDADQHGERGREVGHEHRDPRSAEQPTELVTSQNVAAEQVTSGDAGARGQAVI
jgi:hypothetical protein